MSDKEIVKNEQGGMLAAPDFMGGEATGAEAASKYRTTAFSKIVQSSSNSDLKALFPEGSFILTPENTLVATMGQEFVVIPLVMFTTYEKWKHLDDNVDGGCGVVIEKTMDEDSEIAKCAVDFDRMYEPYPDGRTDRKGNVMSYRYVESLNVIMVIDHCDASPELVGSPFFYSFNKGEFKTGRQFSTHVDRRQKAIFGIRLALKTETHKSKKNPNEGWIGFGINNPTEEQGGGWVVDPTYFEKLRTDHENFVKVIKAGTFEFQQDKKVDGAPKSGADAGGFSGDENPPF